MAEINDTVYALVVEAPQAVSVERVEAGDNTGVSAVVMVLLLLFLVAGIRFRKNSKFLALLMHEVGDTRERRNVFSDTVSETGFLWLLNGVWCLCAGVLVWYGLHAPGITGSLPAAAGAGPESGAAGMGLCAGIAGCYLLFMCAAYRMVGMVFSDAAHTKLWLRGFIGTNALESVGLFPLALIALCYPEASEILCIMAILVVLAGKLMFIWKGFRIFFDRIGTWVLFLYYLCSLEIVPVVLWFAATVYACGHWL